MVEVDILMEMVLKAEQVVSEVVEVVLMDLMVIMHLLKVVNLEPVAAVVVDLVI